MFTGLVEELGNVEAVDASPGGVRLHVRAGLAAQLSPGDSVAVSGVCLTAAAADGATFAADVMRQTLRHTSLGSLAPGSGVNLELPVRVGGRLGGHIVQGHVDGTGRVVAVRDEGFARRLEIRAPGEIRRYLVERGSIAVDGVSLTVAAVRGTGFEVSLIPETVARTTLGDAAQGQVVNLELDVVARYVERLLSGFNERGRGGDNGD